MIPAQQTYFVGDESGVPGNCLQAAIASILDKPLDAVPHFVLFDDWIGALFLYMEGEKLDIRVHKEDPGVECIAVGMSPRDVRHAVIWNKKMIHDPHPSGAGIKEATEFWEIHAKETEEDV